MGRLSRKQLIYLTNINFDFGPLLHQVVQGNPEPGEVIFCPFHHDVNKRSAKVHKDALYCYAEQKQYRSYDVLGLLGFSDSDIEKALLSKQDIIESTPDVISINVLSTEVLDLKRRFILGKIEFNDYVGKVLSSMVSTLGSYSERTTGN